jgi:hypothetical protein
VLLLPQVLEQDARHVAFVAALDEHGAVPAVVGVYESAEGKPAKVPTVNCLQEAGGTGLKHELYHFLAPAARHVHTVVMCYGGHRRCHVPIEELKPRGVDVIPDQMTSVYPLQRGRSAFEAHLARLDPPPVSVDIAAPQPLEQ